MKKIQLLAIGLVIAVLVGCSTKKDILYFNDLQLADKDAVVLTPTKLQPNDIVSIRISSDNPEASVLYNTEQNAAITTNTGVTMQGYLVALDGSITLPILGKIQVDQLTVQELESKIVEQLKSQKHLTNPLVSARLLNAKFTVLGEVASPGTYTYTEQNISLLQALGYAGDLTINGKRTEVLLIREENHQKTYVHIDMTSKKWFDSPYYYIKPNDVIYVTPNGPAVKSAGYIGNLGTFVSLVSLTLSTMLTIIVLSK
ncbi:MAG: polysaccharide biosynthesis/export family protein [Bacteroidia bacterium]|nr:polysaccharide biosynthesis/export family protein [Bacteroidia bacterium]